MNSGAALSNRTILVTRPEGRADKQIKLIEQHGGHAIHYPVLSIEPPEQIKIEQFMRIREQLHSYNMAIFISPTAVEQSFLYFPVLPEHLVIVSIGNKTTKALKKQGIRVDIEAPEQDSESLLQLAEFQMPRIAGQRILIFRGIGGRALLGDTLTQRNAHISYVETYRRGLPPLPPMQEKQIACIDAITISSNEGLDNLVTLMEDPSLLIDIPLIVPSHRAHILARQHGFKHIIQASNATDEAMLDALNHLFSE
jgi:uroporphyrinogen-III synthase